MITFDVDVGQRYTISQKVLDKNDDDGAYVDNHDPFTDLEQKEYTTVVEGECVDFSKIMSTKNRIVSALQNKGYYFASANNPRVDIDRSTKQATVTFSYTCGMQTMVSDVQVCGEGNVPKSFILKRVSLVKGAILKPFNVSHSQKDLFNSGLFSEVNIYATKDGGGSNNNGSNSLLTSSPKYDNAVVHIDVVPAPPRTVGASAYIAASEGGMLAVTWNHKNFLKRALDVGTVLRISSKEASAVAYLNKPDAFRRCQDLHTDVAFRRFNTLAYDGDKTSLTVGLVQRPKHTKHRLTLAFLPTLEHANLKRSDVGVKQTICGASINVRLNTANRDNAPTAGFIFDLSCQPYFGKFTNLSQSAEVSSTNVMGIFTGSIKGYVPLGKGDGDSPNLTNVASFLSLGRISISDFNCIPLDKRFYGGGRDSIRAYGYQLCGELDSDDRPVGGGTLLELCIEPRIRLSENFSSVVFFETSRVYRSAVQPKSLYGMGIGVRYFTRFGPIRFDIAFPFERRTSNKDTSKRIDRRFQFYISVGQSF
jgi:translocation and assembly module TamA